MLFTKLLFRIYRFFFLNIFRKMFKARKYAFSVQTTKQINYLLTLPTYNLVCIFWKSTKKKISVTFIM